MNRAVPISIFLVVTLSLQARAHDPRPLAPGGGPVEPNPTTPSQVFTQMGHSFRADKARGQHLKFQFNLREPQGGTWWIQVNNGNYTMGTGKIGRPDVTFSCTGSDWVRLSNGTLGGLSAFFTGRLRISGNQFAAHKLDDIFP